MHRLLFFMTRRPPVSPYWVLAVALIGISFAGPLVKLSRADPVAIAAWRLGFSLIIVAVLLAATGQWKDWRRLAAMLPIAVLSRPGYGDDARANRAMGWLRRFVRPRSQAPQWTRWSAPAIVFLSLPPDRTSATALRARHPDWHLLTPSGEQRLRADHPAATSNRRFLGRRQR